MTRSDLAETFSQWLNEHMVKDQLDVPARLVTLLGLMERLRTNPDLTIQSHLAPSGMQLIKHNRLINDALRRFEIISPVQEYGRRASNLNAWMPPLFQWLTEQGFASLEAESRAALLTQLQSVASLRLAIINEDKPLVARYDKGTSVAVITDILDQAQAKKRGKDVAEYLVGAKLELRFGADVVEPKHVNAASLGNLADFRIGKTAIEVTTIDRPDESHTKQIRDILADTGLQIWLLIRQKDRQKWQTQLEDKFTNQISRIVVTDVETFVGQNIAEIGKFEPVEVKDALIQLFAIYENKWLPKFGAAGLRIVDLEAGVAE